MRTEELIKQIEDAREQIREAITELVKKEAFQVSPEREDTLFFGDIRTFHYPSNHVSASIALTIFTDLDEATTAIVDEATTNARYVGLTAEIERLQEKRQKLATA